MTEILNLRLEKGAQKLVYSWMLLAIISLVFAGLFAILLALARTPTIQDILPGKDYFRIALIDHVVLSIVIWFLTFKGILWVVTGSGFSGLRPSFVTIGLVGVFIAAIGTSFLIAPALMGLGAPLFTNYIPVIDHPLYYLGLLFFAVGVSLFLINAFATFFQSAGSGKKGLPAETFGMIIAAAAVVIALICYLLAYLTFPEGLKKFVYLEHFFWGGGHILQFAHTIAMLVTWILLVKLTLKVSPVSDRAASFLFLLYFLFILPAPFFYFYFPGGLEIHKLAFTTLMQYGYGLPTIILAFSVVVAIKSRTVGYGVVEKLSSLPWGEPGFSSLIFSIILFASGGTIAIFIQESNTIIPSHYHGVIGAVTISFMGLTHYLIPLMKRRSPSLRLARIQPYLYGVGQLLFVLGMFWAGSHGVARKTYGAAQGLDNFAKIAGMTLMGIGGLVAISGGAVFVYNALYSLTGKKS